MQRRIEESLEQEFIRIQNALKSRLIIPQAQEHSIKEAFSVDGSSIKTIAGVDLAYWKQGDAEYAVCCIVVLDYCSQEVIEKKEYMGRVTVPYVPGCLAFREIPLFLEADRLLENRPDLYFFDGNGYLHPRHMGLASHAGILLEKPAIGVAKSYYKIQNVDYTMPEDEQSAYTDIVIDGEVYGRVLRTHKGVKPVFLSIGNRIDLDAAMTLTNGMVTKDSHIPLPTRLADIMTHEARKRYQKGCAGVDDRKHGRDV